MTENGATSVLVRLAGVDELAEAQARAAVELSYGPRAALPQLDGGLFLTDGGLETTLIFHRRARPALFAAFDLLKDEEGTEALRRYYEPYLELARRRGPRLRAGEPDLAREPALGRAARLLARASSTAMNRKAIALMEEIRDGRQATAADRGQRLRRARRATATTPRS